MLIYKWIMAQEIGYQPKTTFWEDFRIADHFGRNAVKDTYIRAFEEWKDDVEYLTELVMVLNHSIWLHWELGDERMAKLYDALWRDADAYALKNLQGEELRYFLRTTD